MKQLSKNKRSVVLTVKGRAAAVLQDAESYQRLLDIAARADVHEAIRQGLEDVTRGRTRPAREVFDEIRRRHTAFELTTRAARDLDDLYIHVHAEESVRAARWFKRAGTGGVFPRNLAFPRWVWPRPAAKSW